ncbi:MAG: serine/threonine protein kinase [Dokdonella sp.]|nr:MAG: serine/threonine protein kinase [Dokdonella sp.]
MDSERIQRWREADRLFTRWLELPVEHRASWLASEPIDAAVLQALHRLIERHVTVDAAVLPQDLPPIATHAEQAGHNLLAGRQVGDWELLEEIGRGGMSVVYRARRTGVDFEQFAAVKLLGLATMGTVGRARFDQERRVLARLRHPQIAALIDGGVADDGTRFLAMALIDGCTLTEYCQANRLEWRQRVRLVRETCDAVAHAHRNLLVHRDLKPSNILVTAQGVPILIDFGIAKLLDESGEHTQAGMHALTPGYAAPEQVHNGVITTAADVYALGVILRELCASSRALPRDLENIIAMATRADAERRYPDARALGDDLDRLLAQRPVQATPDSLGYRMRAFLRRRKGLATAAASIVLALLAGLGATLWQAREAAQQASEALRQAARANAARDFLFSLFRAGDREQGDELDPPVSTIIARGAAELREQAPDDPELHAEMALLLGHIDTTIGEYERAGEFLDTALVGAGRAGSPMLIAQVHLRKGALANATGTPEAALESFDAATRIASATPEGTAVLVEGLSGWTYAMSNLGRGAQARERIIALLADPARALAPRQRGEAQLALVMVTDDPAARLAALEDAQRQFAIQKPGAVTRMALLSELATTLRQSNRPLDALAPAQEMAALADRMSPGDTIRRARAHNNLGSVLSRASRPGEANAAYATAEAIYRALGDNRSPAFAALLHNRGVLLRDLGAPELGAPLIEEAHLHARDRFGATDPRSLIALRNLALARAEAWADPRADAQWRESWAGSSERPATTRYDFLMVGADIAVHLGQAAVALERLAQADTLANREALTLTPLQQTRTATIRGTALSLGPGWQHAEAEFSRAADLSTDAGWGATWRNELARAEHRQRHPGTGDPAAQFAVALRTLESVGRVPDSNLLRSLQTRTGKTAEP